MPQTSAARDAKRRPKSTCSAQVVGLCQGSQVTRGRSALLAAVLFFLACGARIGVDSDAGQDGGEGSDAGQDAGSVTPCNSLTDAGSPTFQCVGVVPVTLTTVEADVFKPICAQSGCHDGSPVSLAPTDYSSVTATARNVGQVSTYGNGLKVIAPSNLIDSTMWLKVLGGSPPTGQYFGPACISVGSAMPQTGPRLDGGAMAEIKGWICNGAPSQ